MYSIPQTPVIIPFPTTLAYLMAAIAIILIVKYIIAFIRGR